jgi:Dolichyl-phosphate-mannose-protein mannosyltransferase
VKGRGVATVFLGAGEGAPNSILRFHVLFIVLVLAYLVLYLPFLDQVTAVVLDEPWYANTAHNLATGHGLINTNVGQRGGDEFFLYVVIVSGVFKFFGTSLWIGRFVSVVIGLIAFSGFAVLCRRLAIREWSFAVTGGLFIVSNVYFLAFRRLRPEGLVIAFSVWALYFFVTTWQTRRFSAALVCALLAGGSVLAHPYGAPLAVLFALLLAARAVLERSDPWPVLGYLLGGIATIALLLVGWGLLQERPVLQLVEDLVSSGRVSTNTTALRSAIWPNVTTFVSAYSLGLKRAYILLFEVGILLVGLLYYRRDRLTALLSFTGVFWLMANLVLFTPFFRWMFGIFVIFSLVVVGRVLSQAVTAPSHTGLRILWVLTLLYGLNGLAGDAYVIKRDVSNTPYTSLTETLHGNVPDSAPLLTHLELWFAFKRNPVYTALTPRARLSQLLECEQVRYAVLSATYAKVVSPTLGVEESHHVKHIGSFFARFYNEAHSYALAHGRRIAVLPTRGYGEIEIWEMRGPTSNRCSGPRQ